MTRLALIGALLFGTAALAQEDPLPQVLANCKPVDEVMQLITGKFHENPVWMGQTAMNGPKITTVLLMNKETGTWTFLGTAEGRACIFGAGVNAVLRPVGQEL